VPEVRGATAGSGRDATRVWRSGQVPLSIESSRSRACAASAWQPAGIEVLCFKGLGLLGDTYPTQHLRAIGDADVLIRRERVPDALRIMRRLGWRSGRLHRS
jgi:hypothetical protein